MTARRSGQDPLTRERIVTAALQIVDTEGMRALSMRRLGTALQVDPSSIYYHVPNKSALYDLVMDAVMSELDLSGDDPQATAEERVLLGVNAFAAALLAHPHAIPLILSRPFMTEESLRPAEHLLGVMLEAGLDETTAMAGINAIAYYVLGATLTYSHHLLDSEYHTEFDADRFANLSEAEFPHIRALIGPYSIGADFAEEFALGARALVRGLLCSLPESST